MNLYDLTNGITIEKLWIYVCKRACCDFVFNVRYLHLGFLRSVLHCRKRYGLGQSTKVAKPLPSFCVGHRAAQVAHMTEHGLYDSEELMNLSNEKYRNIDIPRVFKCSLGVGLEHAKVDRHLLILRRILSISVQYQTLIGIAPRIPVLTATILEGHSFQIGHHAPKSFEITISRAFPITWHAPDRLPRSIPHLTSNFSGT